MMGVANMLECLSEQVRLKIIANFRTPRLVYEGIINVHDKDVERLFVYSRVLMNSKKFEIL